MENKKIKTFTEFNKGVITCTKIAIVITIVFSIMQGRNFSLSVFGMTLLISFSYSFVIGFGNGLINSFLDKKWDWLTQTNARVYYGIVATVLYTIPAVLAINYFTFIYINKMPVEQFFDERTIWIHLFYVILSLCVSTLMHARSFMVNWKNAAKIEVTQQKIIAGTANAKFESLKNQIDPHFLFNSLNVLSSLIEENPENAQRFTTSLSKIYRYVLEQKDKELVTVQEELAFAKTYMNLLKMRFENSITFDLPTDFDNDDAKVVPLSLQLLLENTIKHNVVSEQKPLHIKIYVKDNYLVVENNLQKKEVLQDRRGVGIQNIVSRYAILSKRNVLIDETSDVFAVHLPILTKQVTVMETNTYPKNANTAYFRAKKRVEQLKGFYGNLISYCLVIPVLAFINLQYMPEFQWFWFSAAGWGFGVTMHAFKVFGYGKNWEERKIAAILEKEKSTKKWK